MPSGEKEGFAWDGGVDLFEGGEELWVCVVRVGVLALFVLGVDVDGGQWGDLNIIPWFPHRLPM
jgi:hypothetical protein